MSRRPLDFTDLVAPTERQQQFWDAVDRHKYVLYGGARGGGKSYILRWTLVRLLLHWGMNEGKKNVRVGLFCEDYPALADRQLSKVKIEFPDWMGKYVDGAKEFRLVDQLGGGVICFRNLDDAAKYQSAEFAAMAVDELTKNGLEVFNLLRGSLRWPGIDRTRFIAASNPGGPGHLWVRSYFIDGRFPPEMEDQAGEFAYVKALPTDNPHNSPEYIRELASLPDALRKAFLEGSWDVFEGQVFSEWRDDLHVIPDFTPPPNWVVYGGMDWGYRAPGWFGLCAVGPEGDVVWLDEIYFREEHAGDVGKRIGLMCKRYAVQYIAADEQMWYQTGASAPTIAEECQDGINLVAGQGAPSLIQATHGRGSRSTKLQVMRRYLHWRETKDAEGNPEVKPWHRPMMRFTRRCKHAIRTIPALPYSRASDHGKPDDVDTHAEDHPYDGVTAFLMSRPTPGEEWQGRAGEDDHPGFTRSGRRKVPTYERVWRELEEQREWEANPVYRHPNQWEANDGWI